MRSVLGTKDCYGCGVCAASCTRNAISMKLGYTGFWEPEIHGETCIHCGVCADVCSFRSDDVERDGSSDVRCFAGWSLNPGNRNACSSGGVAFEIARLLMKKDYGALVCRYNSPERQAEHYLAKTEEELKPSIGSKYLQSNSYPGFSQLRKGGKYLVAGTPCQIDSVRRWVKKQKMEERVVLLDFFCHGVPSMLMWDKYCSEVENKIGKIDQIAWRDKSQGWHDSWVMKAGDRYASKYSDGDLFYRMFLKNRCLAEACYEKCKFKGLASAADIRVGDLWGSKFLRNDEGVSGVVGLTRKGLDLLGMMDSVLHLEPSTAEIVCESQMKKCAPRPISYGYVLRSLPSKKTMAEIDRIASFLEQIEEIPRTMRYYAFRFPKKVKELLHGCVLRVKS